MDEAGQQRRQAMDEIAEGQAKLRHAFNKQISNLIPTESEQIDSIIQEMLLQYTDWVNGKPVAWNVKKAEATAQLLALNRAARKESLQEVFGMRPIVGMDRIPSSDLVELIDNIKNRIGELSATETEGADV